MGISRTIRRIDWLFNIKVGGHWPSPCVPTPQPAAKVGHGGARCDHPAATIPPMGY
jgi:hypothetical protein